MESSLFALDSAHLAPSLLVRGTTCPDFVVFVLDFDHLGPPLLLRSLA